MTKGPMGFTKEHGAPYVKGIKKKPKHLDETVKAEGAERKGSTGTPKKTKAEILYPTHGHRR